MLCLYFAYIYSLVSMCICHTDRTFETNQNPGEWNFFPKFIHLGEGMKLSHNQDKQDGQKDMLLNFLYSWIAYL